MILQAAERDLLKTVRRYGGIEGTTKAKHSNGAATVANRDELIRKAKSYPEATVARLGAWLAKQGGRGTSFSRTLEEMRSPQTTVTRTTQGEQKKAIFGSTVVTSSVRMEVTSTVHTNDAVVRWLDVNIDPAGKSAVEIAREITKETGYKFDSYPPTEATGKFLFEDPYTKVGEDGHYRYTIAMGAGCSRRWEQNEKFGQGREEASLLWMAIGDAISRITGNGSHFEFAGVRRVGDLTNFVVCKDEEVRQHWVRGKSYTINQERFANDPEPFRIPVRAVNSSHGGVVGGTPCYDHESYPLVVVGFSLNS